MQRRQVVYMPAWNHRSAVNSAWYLQETAHSGRSFKPRRSLFSRAAFTSLGSSTETNWRPTILLRNAWCCPPTAIPGEWSSMRRWPVDYPLSALASRAAPPTSSGQTACSSAPAISRNSARQCKKWQGTLRGEPECQSRAEG